MRHRLVKLALSLSAVAVVAGYLFPGRPAGAFSSGPPPSLTRAPNEGSCVDCHSSFPLNDGPGALTITGLPAGYSPNQEVAVTVTLTQANRDRYGFQLTALDDTGSGAGALIVTDPVRTQLLNSTVFGHPRSYIEHTFDGTAPSGSNQGSWAFTWRAPSSGAGRVTFYAAGNAANGDGGTGGDFIYTATAIVRPAAQGPTVASLNPNTAAARGPAFTMAVTGASFVNGSVVRWNNSDRPTNFISGTQLTARISAGDIASPGSAGVAVFNPASGASNVLTFTIAAAGLEADVAPRPNGSGAVTIIDWVQVGRFAAGLDAAANPGEFQRADCAPKETLGNGSITISDWVQAGRYVAGLDAASPAGGPTSPIQGAIEGAESESTIAAFENDAAQKRVVRAVREPSGSDQIFSLIIQLDAQGDEHALGFSLHFDPGQLRFAGAALSQELSLATLIINAGQAARGRIGIALMLPHERPLASGDGNLMTINFIAVNRLSPEDAQIAFGDVPVAREIVDVNARSLIAIYADGTQEDGSTCAAGVELQRQVKQAGGRWNPARRVWEIRYDRAVALGLKDRITELGR